MEEIFEGGIFMSVKRVSYKRLFEGTFSPGLLLHEEMSTEYNTKLLIEAADVNPKDQRFDVKNYENETIEYVEISSIDKSSGKIKELKKILKENSSSRIRLIANQGNILIPLIATEKFMPVWVEHNNTIVSDNFAVIVPKYEGEYIYSCFKEENVISQIKARYRGAVIQRLPLSELNNIKLPWSNSRERNYIAEKQRTLLKSNEKGKNVSIEIVNNTLKKYLGIKEKNDSLVVKRVDYENLKKESWESRVLLKENYNIEQSLENGKVYNLSELCETTVGVNQAKFKDDSQPIPVLKASNIEPFEIKGEIRSVDINLNKIIEKGDYELKVKDIIMRVKGAKLGSCALVSEEQEGMVFNDTVLRIRLLSEEIHPEYLLAYLNSYIGIGEVKKFERGSTIKYINQNDINNMTITTLPMNLQKKITKDIFNEDS
jgi:restriction endonuclease S subunit